MKIRSESSPVRLALIGAGAIAQSYAAAFADSCSARLVAVADTDLGAARRLAGPLQVPVFRSHGDLLDAADIDGAIVCTPPAFHMEIAIDALAAGVHVLCEKPLAIGAFSAQRMFAAAEAAGRILTMASKFRFVEDIRAARDVIGSGRIGEILRVDNTFMSSVDMTGRWNSRVALSGGGVLIDNGTHSVDIMRFLLGPIGAALAIDMSADLRYGDCEDSVHLFVRSATDTIGLILLSWSVGTTDPTFLRIYGSAGTIDIGWRESTITFATKPAAAFGKGYDKRAAFCAQIDDFAGAIKGECEPAISAADAIASVDVIDAAYASLCKNAWTPVAARRVLPALRSAAG